MSIAKHTPMYVGAMNDALFIINEQPRPVPTDSINTNLKTKVLAKIGEEYCFAEQKEIADLIVTACNSHNDLLEALKTTLNALEDICRQLPTDERLADYELDYAEEASFTARAAIAQAEGGAK